jgi:hypothetical protein
VGLNEKRELDSERLAGGPDLPGGGDHASADSIDHITAGSLAGEPHIRRFRHSRDLWRRALRILAGCWTVRNRFRNPVENQCPWFS